MSYNPTVISNNILKRAFESKIDVSPMKLQKILYFVASEYMKKAHKPLFDEPFKKWKYGPVVGSVYSEFKAFKGDPIRKFSKDATGAAYIIDEAKNPVLQECLDDVWEAAKHLTAAHLSRITHKPGSAWHEAYVQSADTLDPEQVAADTTYLIDLGLGPSR